MPWHLLVPYVYYIEYTESANSMKQKILTILKWSEKYTKTDMVYLASGTFWGNLNAIIVTGLSFSASVLFARYFSKEEYGMYQFTLSIASLIGATTLSGMNSAVTRAVARGHEGELKHSVKYQLIAGIIPFIIGLGIAGWYLLHGNTALAIAFSCIALFLPLNNAFNTWLAYLGGKKIFRIGAYYGMANNTVNYTAILLTIYFARNFLWVIVANYTIAFISCFIIYKLVLRKFPPNEERDLETIPYGVHLSFMGILGTFASQLDSLLVFHFIGPAALAVYSFATLLPEKLAGILKFIPNLALPKLATLNELQVRHVIFKKLWMVIILISVTAIAYASVAPLIFTTFFPKYTESIQLTQLYSLSFFSIVVLMVQTILVSQRKTKELYAVNVTIPIVRALLMIVLMYYYGIWGLLWAQILINFISFGFQLILLARKPVTQTV